ncbi:hypothetical protein EDC38_0062 [Marinimicrobium koreense]|uniref:Uncharacterized protein n=1 Tax=Marinimicrobium koreense TaxID=306545 RepID=A0A3N1NYL1_9GAMM|nr:hypothetical protein [Marinimicrobium koreense]ROQ19480.1 hypothetical protein EDC38_0062 [Marinimicrobium koreense]
MRITSDFDKLSFHDAGIAKIVREDGCILISIEGAFISSDHPQAGEKDWVVESGTLKLLGVISEEAKYWDDTKAAREHPQPEMPLDEIMHASLENDVFHFDGFRGSVPWFEWFVTAQGFALEVIAANEKNS